MSDDKLDEILRQLRSQRAVYVHNGEQKLPDMHKYGFAMAVQAMDRSIGIVEWVKDGNPASVFLRGNVRTVWTPAYKRQLEAAVEQGRKMAGLVESMENLLRTFAEVIAAQGDADVENILADIKDVWEERR